MATTYRRDGFTLVELLIAVGAATALTGLVLSAVQKVRSAAARAECANNLRQIGLALHHHHDVNRHFPPAILRARNDDYPYMTWLTRVLPYLEQGALWDEARAEYARDPLFWHAPRHAPASRPVPVFICPADGRGQAVARGGFLVAFTHYLGVSGARQVPDDGILIPGAFVRLADVTDGTSHTIAVGERPPSPDGRWGWWYAGVGQELTGSADMVLSAITYRVTSRTPTCPRGPYRFGPGSAENICDIFHFWSRHPGGANFLMADGAVKFVGYTVEPDLLPALATRNGGETVTTPD